MTAGLRLTITALPLAFAAGCLAAPLAAQDNVQAATPPASNGVIGPSELRDFSLKGPVTREAPPAAAVPVPRDAAPAATRAPQSTTAAPPRAPRSDQAPLAVGAPAVPPSQTAPSLSAPAAEAPRSPSASVTFSLPAATAGTAADAPSNLGSQPGLVPVEPPPSASIAIDSGPILWPWLLAALAAALAILYYAMRQRSRPVPELAGAGALAAPDALTAPQLSRAPRSPEAAPAPPPAPPPPISAKLPGMIVSTRLRPQIEVQFVPERLIVDREQVTIQFAALILNSGNAPARDVLVEAAMFNAGETLDQELGNFFANPVAKGERIPELLPLKTMTLRSSVVLPVGQVRVFEVEGRALFVPLVGFNAVYRSNGKDAQTSESYIVGIDTQAERMAPFRLDGEPRQFRNLGARAHTVRLRK